MLTTVVDDCLRVQRRRRTRSLPFFLVAGILMMATGGHAASVSVATSLTASQTQQFTASITGNVNAGIAWSLSPAVGTISSTGLYTAPAVIASAQNVTVKATSTADPTKSARSTISLIPVTVLLTPSTTSLTISQTQQFTTTVTGTANTGVTWSLSPAVGTISSTGLYIAPASVTGTQNVSVIATSTADPTKSASSTISLIPVTISLSPSTTSLIASQTQQFTATVTGTANVGVAWSLSPAAGTISAAGLYTAPAAIATAQTVTVMTTSVADPAKSASATVTLNPPVNVTVAPASVTLTQSQTQSFAATVTNTGNSAVTWSLSPLVGSITAAGVYTAPASITSPQTVAVKVTSAADTTKSATAAVTLNPPVNVTVSPASATLTQSQTQSFAPTVTNTGNTAVTWSLSPVVGSITAAGLYTAPASITSSQAVTVKATSAADPTKSGAATVTLTPPVTVSLTPLSVSLLPSQNQTFTATVSGTSNTGVTWSISPALGGLATSATTAVYVAPSTAPTTQSVTVTAASVADPSKTVTALITLRLAVTVSLSPSTVSLAPSGTQQFTATVLGTSNTAMTWSINPSVGTISSAGLYTAPSSILTSQTVTVTAQTAADPTKSAIAAVSLQTTPLPSQWSIGYYSANDMPVTGIQWAGLTHISHACSYVNADGTLDVGAISPYAATLVTTAHANQVKVLSCLAANGPATNFDQAIGNHLSTLVTNIMTVVNTYGYDGVDIDWEGEAFNGTQSGTDMINFAAALRTALGSKLLTVDADVWDWAYWGTAYASFDRISVMTYAWTCYANVPWFTSPLYDQGDWYGACWSLDKAKSQFIAAGVPTAKLNLGLGFFGRQYSGGVLASNPTQGVSGPRQVWQTGSAPTSTLINYNSILPMVTPQNYNWDTLSVVPYLSYIGTTPPTSWYLTYDNPQSIQAKVRYIIAQNLGGWIIWDLGGDWIPGAARPHPLLDAVQAGSAR